MKNWSTQKKIVWGLVIIALIVAAYNWKAIAKQFGYNGSEMGAGSGNGSGNGVVADTTGGRANVTTSTYGRCKRYKSSNGTTWCQYGEFEVPCGDCGGSN